MFFLHFHQNSERKLQELGVSSIIITEYKKDIFGDSEYLQLGLIDTASKSELESKLASLQNRWNKLENLFILHQNFIMVFRTQPRSNC